MRADVGEVAGSLQHVPVFELVGRKVFAGPHSSLRIDPASRGEAPQRIRQEAVERLRAVERAMARLPEQQRRCLILVVRDELSYRQAGALLDLSELTVRNHLREARRRLRLEVNVPEVPS